MKSSPSLWQLLNNVKSTVKISSILVAFLENMNFTNKIFCSIVLLKLSQFGKILKSIAP